MTFADPTPEYWQQYGHFQHIKHRLIKHYLDGWFPKLGTWAGRVLYVDTHAGRGRHSSGQAGSPLVALNTLLSHHYRDELLKRSEVIFLFIERDPANLASLQRELSGIGDFPPGVLVKMSAGNAYEVLESIVKDFHKSGQSMAPAFIFVDPYGFKVPGALLSQLMASGRVELFINVIWRELDMAIQQRQPPGHGLGSNARRNLRGRRLADHQRRQGAGTHGWRSSVAFGFGRCQVAHVHPHDFRRDGYEVPAPAPYEPRSGT